MTRQRKPHLLALVESKPVLPEALVTDEKIELGEWELQDFVVQVVRDHITNSMRCKVVSTNGNPFVEPPMWYVGDHRLSPETA